jgi:DNA-binding CsgD family transcriptional regulator
VKTSEDPVDQIYEAAVAPERWPAVLDSLSKLADGNGAILFTSGLQKWVASEEAQEFVQEYVAQGWPARTDRSLRLFAANHPGFLSDLDVYTRDELDKEPVFTEFLRPRGFGWGVATAISAPSGDLIAFDVERLYSRGPVERETIRSLDYLRPHLARAALISGRLFLERLQSAAAILDAIGLAAAVLGESGRPLAVNSCFERLIPHVARERRDRIEIVNASADALLVDALARIGPSGDGESVRSIPVAATRVQPPMVLHLIPMRGAARDIFSGAEAILVITPLTLQEAPKAELLQGLFDLTPAEARVARAIAQRKAIDGIAAEFSLSRETIRSQVKSVLAKTGCARQVDLAVVLASTVLHGCAG